MLDLEQTICLQELLEERPIASSAPCRVDCGGTWDLKAFWLPYRHIEPVTVNIALDLRTSVELLPNRQGYIKVTSVGFHEEEYPHMEAPFSSPLGFAFAVATYFNVTSVHIDIRSESPPRSALGGSGVLGVALVSAFSKAMVEFGRDIPSRKEIVEIAYSLEDSISVSLSGCQDQAAAAYGGVSKWCWGTEDGFNRTNLIDDSEQVKHFNDRMIVAYCGLTHHSSTVNTLWVENFLNGKERNTWFAINDLTKSFASALNSGEFHMAAEILKEETRLRASMTPGVLVPVTKALIEEAESVGCGARFAGSGGGGCVWAIGEVDATSRLRLGWQKILDTVENGKILNTYIDTNGVA